jgi:hypothetical protein
MAYRESGKLKTVLAMAYGESFVPKGQLKIARRFSAGNICGLQMESHRDDWGPQTIHNREMI